MLSTLVSLVSYQAPLPAVRSRAGAACMQTKEELATALCPAIGYWDPLGMTKLNLFGNRIYGNVAGDTDNGTLRDLGGADVTCGSSCPAGFYGSCNGTLHGLDERGRLSKEGVLAGGLPADTQHGSSEQGSAEQGSAGGIDNGSGGRKQWLSEWCVRRHVVTLQVCVAYRDDGM